MTAKNFLEEILLSPLKSAKSYIIIETWKLAYKSFRACTISSFAALRKQCEATVVAAKQSFEREKEIIVSARFISDKSETAAFMSLREKFNI